MSVEFPNPTERVSSEGSTSPIPIPREAAPFIPLGERRIDFAARSLFADRYARVGGVYTRNAKFFAMSQPPERFNHRASQQNADLFHFPEASFKHAVEASAEVLKREIQTERATALKRQLWAQLKQRFQTNLHSHHNRNNTQSS